MKRVDVKTEQLYVATLFGKQVLWTELRVDKTTIPDGLHVYEARHSDGYDWTTPVTVEKGVWANFCGTILSREIIELDTDGFPVLYLEGEDFYCCWCCSTTAQDYLTNGSDGGLLLKSSCK